jgi:hypothetical protein
MNNHVKNQHYVPQFLLRNFCSSTKNLIWCYDKMSKKCKERSISNIASEDCFYDKEEGRKEGSLEYLLGRAENDTSLVISKIIKTKNLDALNIDEATCLALFISLQLLRTKASLSNIDRMNEQLISRIKEFVDDIDGKVNIPLHSAREVWLSMFNSAPELAQILMKKIWFLIESKKIFYTSDNPVVLQNTTNIKENRGTLGLNCDGIEIYFPISDSLVLCLLCERTYGLISDHKFPITEENIENINSLQVYQSERYVFSSKEEFNLVSEMLD